jgi:hypothetical protein
VNGSKILDSAKNSLEKSKEEISKVLKNLLEKKRDICTIKRNCGQIR